MGWGKFGRPSILSKDTLLFWEVGKGRKWVCLPGFPGEGHVIERRHSRWATEVESMIVGGGLYE